jgi:hypothetical protein
MELQKGQIKASFLFAKTVFQKKIMTNVSPSARTILLIWMGWAVVLFGFQSLVQMRVSLERPDYSLSWTPSATRTASYGGNVFVADPFLNAHVAWDSGYYLAIAVDGYDSARSSALILDPPSIGYCVKPSPNCMQLAYAFFPLYPLLIRLFSFPLKLFSLSVIGTATLAAILISLLGTLTAMFSIYSMSRKSLGEDGGVRAAFYLLIFPTSLFLAQVYSEGVFIGITFAALAFLTARKWGWAALFGTLAVWTRPGGAMLVLPFLIIWVLDKTWKKGTKEAVLHLLAVLSPVLSYLIWRVSPLAKNFFLVEKNFFGSGFLNINKSMTVWSEAWQLMLHGNSQARFYYGLEFAAIFLTLFTCILLIKKRPELSWYGLAVVLFAFTAGTAHSMVRYVLAAPTLFYVTAKWGKHQYFDRAWTVACVLLLGLEAMLFSFNFWVA